MRYKANLKRVCVRYAQSTKTLKGRNKSILPDKEKPSVTSAPKSNALF